jgi:HlyD family secretion protein
VAPAGGFVQKGAKVAEFDRQMMLLRLDDYRASVRQQELDMMNLRANLEVSRNARGKNIESGKGQVEKAQLDLKTTPVRSAMDAERLRLTLEEAQARYKELQEEVKFADASDQASIRIEEMDFQRASLELKRAEMNADKMISKAPIDGLVVMQNIRRGTEMGQVQQGDQLFPGQFFMQIVDNRSMVVNATVNQVDVDPLRIGAKARVRFDAYPDLVLPAHIYSIGAVTNQGGMRASFVKEVPVKLKLDALDSRVIPDLSVSVDVILDSEQKAAAIVPLESVFKDGEGGMPSVFVQAPMGWERRGVELGLSSNTSVAVRSGLKAGEVVALSRPPVVKQP